MTRLWHALKEQLARIRGSLGRHRLEADFDEEVEEHLVLLTERFIRRGLSPDEARFAARKQFGGVTQAKNEVRDRSKFRPLEAVLNLLTDVRFALRVACRNWLFSLLVMLSLSLGVAATSAVFSMVYSVLIDPFPYRDARKISLLRFFDEHNRSSLLLFPVSDYRRLVDAATTLQNSFAFKRTFSTTTRGLPESVVQGGFSPGAFSFLGMPMSVGRSFGPADIPKPEAPPSVVVLSQTFWRHYYGGDMNVIGKTLELDHQPLTIIGIAQSRFAWAGGDVFVPLRSSPGGGPEISIAVRPREGLSERAVSGQIDALTHRFAEINRTLYPRGFFRVRAISMADDLVGNARQTLILLSSASAFLLLVACANVSILLFARATARQKEMAVRISLGASTWRIVQQLLTEAVILSLTGALLGLVLASTALHVILLLLPGNTIPNELRIVVNSDVVLLTFIVCFFTGILFGLLPAIEASRPAVNQSMQQSGPGAAGRPNSGRSRGMLIAAEVSLTTLLITSAAILIQELVSLHQVKLGYDPSNVISISLPLAEGQHTTWAARAELFERILNDLGSIRGVLRAAATEDAVPPRTGFPAAFEIPGQQTGPAQNMQIALVSEGYFSTLRISLLRGRLLTANEVRMASSVAVINDEMARRYWAHGRDPIGARIHVPALHFANHTVLTPPGGDQWFQIVGIVGSALNEGLQEPPSPSLYVSYKLAITPRCHFLLRTESDPHTFISAIRARIKEIDPDVPAGEPLTLEEQLNDSDRALPRFLASLFSVFGSIALGLAATGVYSIVSYSVERRRRELGIRLALGAMKGKIVWLVLSGTASYVSAGLGLGLFASYAASRMIPTAAGAWSFSGSLPIVAAMLLLLISLIASCIPSLKATRIAPSEALRHE